SPIVFAGADLAYTGGALYCRNTVYEPEWSHLHTPEARSEEFKDFLAKQSTLQEPDVDGRPVLTAPRFVQFRNWILQQSSSCTSVVNATGGGILHGGSVVQSSFDALNLPELPEAQRDLRQRLRSLWDANKPVRSTRRARLLASMEGT